MWCWGRNQNGQLGRGSATAQELVPAPVTGLPVAFEVESGSDHSCAQSTTGEIWCWGANASGQLGDALPMPFVASPVRALGITGSHVAPATEHTCARGEDSFIRCWGANDRGQLGDGTTTPAATAVTVRLGCD